MAQLGSDSPMTGIMKQQQQNEKKKKRKKSKSSTILMIFIFIIGISLIVYPTLANKWNSFHQTKMIIHHAENVAKLTPEECEKYRAAAVKYNEALRTNSGRWNITHKERELYNSLLVTDETGIMSTIEIPKIKVNLPIYHGTGKDVLQEAIGHLEGTSLPVGGKGTHCVLSGHRGLPSAKLFTDLDKLSEGDTFLLYTLDEILTYEIDQIRVLEPTDLSTLDIDAEKDYCTIFTCTPYGINTHRLMLRGHRIQNASPEIMVTAEALQIDEISVALIIGVPLLIIIFIVALIKGRKRRIPMRMRLQQEV